MLRGLARDLMADTRGAADVQRLLGVSRQYATRLVTTKGFPDPVLDDDRLRLWLRLDVARWLDANRPDWREGR